MFCGGCGRPLSQAAAPGPVSVSDAPRSVGAERRQLTVMFCDLVGSTALASRLDPEDLREVIGAYHECVAETIERYNGFIARFMGDGVLIYFGYPHAHEDDAERAVKAGLAVVGDLIGSGAPQEQAVIGETPNLAARLQALAGTDEVVIPESTRRLVGNLFDYQSLGKVEVKGFVAAILAFRVVREGQVGSRFEALRTGETPLVGREEEIELLGRRWAQAKSGAGRVVLVSGEPRIGKSRLVEGFGRASKVSPTPDCGISAHHITRTALSSRSLGNSSGQPVSSTTTRLRRGSKGWAFVAASAPAEGDLPLLAELLSILLDNRDPAPDLTPQRKKENCIAPTLSRSCRRAACRI
jgi:class 3 adenylate cyclase